MEEDIIDLLVSFLGDYSKKCGEWYSFNCPCCADENGGFPDNKYNMEVNINLDVKGCGGFHCWKCGDINGTKGTLVKLFKKYAPHDTYTEFKRSVSDYRSSQKYELFSDKSDLLNEFDDTNDISLPQGFRPINKNEKPSQEAYEYLRSRGITDKIIKGYNIGYINNSTNYSLQKRVYIPSYDEFDNLTYWVGRDYTNKNKQKTKNPKISKTKIIFNEGKINWYEPVTLVEGPFDHIVTPNSIPLLGKTLNEDYALYNTIMLKAHSEIRIFLDDDATKDAYKIYKLLNTQHLRDRIRLVETPEGYDPSLIFQEYGYKGILELLCSSVQISEYELLYG